MATTVYKRKSKITGAISFVAQVRVKPYSVQQETFRVTVDTKATRKAADEWASAKEKELQDQAVKGISKDLTQMTVGKLINAYLEAPETKQLKTNKDVERLVGWWLAEFNSTKLLEFDTTVMRAARDKLVRDKGNIATTNRYVSAMRKCWNWGRQDTILKVPAERRWAEKIMFSEKHRRRKRFLNEAERNLLLEAAKPDKVLHTAILVSLACGVRQTELLNLHWKHIDWKNARLTLYETKNGDPRVVHAPSAAISALQTLKKSKVVSATTVFLIGAGKPLKQSTLIKRFRKLVASIQLPTTGKDKVTWHTLRHTTASMLAQNSASPIEVMTVLGHKSLAMVTTYTHLFGGAKVTGHDAMDKSLGGKS